MRLSGSSCWLKPVILLIIVVFTWIWQVDAEERIIFPQDGGVINVLDYGAVPNDQQDDTAAIQKALNEHANGNRIIYLPAGEYLVTDTLKWGSGERGGMEQKRTILQGEGQSATIIRLPDGAAGFGGDEKSAKAVIWTGNKPAQRFRNAIRDLTIHTGKNNPGAIGVQFNASNQGTMRNVRIISGDGYGVYGLDLGFTDEIGPLLVRDVEIEGFNVGIRTWWPVNSCTFEHITLRNQLKYGWHNYHQMIFVRGLKSFNKVPVIFNQKDSWGTVSLIDSELQGLPGAEAQPAILNQRQLYIRNTKISGYGTAVDNADKGRDKGDIREPGLIVEETSHKNVVLGIKEMPDTLPQGGLTHLPVKETPVVPWGDIKEDWVNILSFGADKEGKQDATSALQQAIDSGKKTIYLPGGINFYFNGEVQIKSHVERIIGLEGRCTFGEHAIWRVVNEPDKTEKPLIIERCNNASGGRGVNIMHEADRPLIVSSWIGANITGRSQGDLFLDDTCVKLNLEIPGQHAWCRQLNTESTTTNLTNNGGLLWILGMKTEKSATIIHTRNQGITDLTGLNLYNNEGWDNQVPAFLIEDSRVMLTGLNERHFGKKPCRLWFREIKNGITADYAEQSWVFSNQK